MSQKSSVARILSLVVMITDRFSPVDSLIDFNDCSQVELASLANKVGQFLSIMEHFGEAEEILLDAHQSLTEVCLTLHHHRSLEIIKGFAKKEKVPNIQDYYGSGWVGPGLTRIFFF